MALRVCAALIPTAVPAIAATIAVPSGGNLQAAIDSAQAGDTIALEPGATYTGTFKLPNKSGSTLITIRTEGDAGLPGEGERIAPSHAESLAKIRSGSSSPAFETSAGAHHWRLQLLEIQANNNGAGDIVTLGDGSSAQNALSQIANNLVVDRVYIHGDPAKGQKRGIALNSASTTITGSYIADVKAVGQDSQAIGGWNGPGPFTITNNYLEAAGENLMFGGADPAVPGLVPSDITITDNDFAKQTAWRSEKWVVKNLIELKNARRVTIARNTFEYNWQGGQSGYAVVFTVRNQDGRCPWCQVEQVTFQQNIVRHSAAGIQILGYDNNHPSQQTRGIVVRDNLFADIDTKNWGGNGYFLSLTGGARDITIDHNTIIQDHASGIVQADGAPVLGFVFTNNLAKHNNYGIIGTNHGIGNDSIGAFLPGSEIDRNVMAGGAASRYPTGNSFPSGVQFEGQFVGYGGGDFRLSSNSPWRGAATDGLDLGAMLDQPIGDAGGRILAPPPRALALNIGTDLPSGAVGAPYAGSLTVSGGEGPYTWTIAAGALPDGLGFDAASGTIAGQPQTKGRFPLRIVVRDSSSPDVQGVAEVTLLVRP
jgi:putative Ig domain-containing protein/parallel beta helix pectate lyase-like protein